MTLEDYAEANAVLNRAQQIIRINEGLYTSSQYAILHKKIENFANWGDWSDARQLLDHLFWLYTHKYTCPDYGMVAGLLMASYLPLRGLLEGEVQHQSYPYRRAAMHSRVALTVAEAVWHSQDPRLGQLIYERIKHAYLHALAIQRRSTAGYELRSFARSTSSAYKRYIVLDRDVARSIHRGNGYLYLRKLRRLYLNRETPDLEAAAMVSLYRADWQVLFQQREMAVVSYADAYAELLAAGVPQPLVDELFANPRLIPEPNFYPAVSTALASRRNNAQTTLGPVRPTPIQISFDEWPLESPLSSDSGSALATAFADPAVALFSFSLTGAEESRRRFWRSRRWTSLGVAQNLQLIYGGFSTDVQQEALVENLNWLRFRPKLVDGVPQAATGVIASY